MGFRWGRVCAVLTITVTVLTSLFLTFPRSAEAQEELQEFPATLKADSYKFDRQARILTAQGNVVFTTRDVTIRADVLVADLQTSLVSAEGHVRLDAAGQSVIADMLTYNLGTRTGTLFNAHTEYRSPWVLGAVTLKAKDGSSGRVGPIFSMNVTMALSTQTGSSGWVSARELSISTRPALLRGRCCSTGWRTGRPAAQINMQSSTTCSAWEMSRLVSSRITTSPARCSAHPLPVFSSPRISARSRRGRPRTYSAP